MAPEDSEFKTWLYAFLFMAFLSAAVFAADRSGVPFFNLAFEVCAVYVPTAVMFIIVAIVLRRKMEWPQPQ